MMAPQRKSGPRAGWRDASSKVDAHESTQSPRKRSHTLRTVLACVLVGILLAVPAVFVNTAIGYIPIVAFLLLLLLSFAYLRVLRSGLEFSGNDAMGECVRGQSRNFSLTVSNKSFLPAVRVGVTFYLSDLFGGQGSTSTRNVTLPPRQEKTFDFGIRFDHIGAYRVGIRSVTVCDPLGIFSYTLENDRLTWVNVLPQLFEVEGLQLSKDASIEARKRFSAVINDGMDYSGVRNYQWGDPIKAIHWKLSSRLPEAEYLTRLYETNANPGMAVVVDFDAPAYGAGDLMDVFDAVVECAFSLEAYAATHGFDAELLFADGEGRPCRYLSPLAGNRREVLERMPRKPGNGGGNDALNLVRNELKSAFAQSNLVVCSAMITQELAESLIAARSKTRSLLLFAIIPDDIEGQQRDSLMSLLRRLGRAGVHYRVIADAEELEHVAREARSA